LLQFLHSCLHLFPALAFSEFLRVQALLLFPDIRLDAIQLVAQIVAFLFAVTLSVNGVESRIQFVCARIHFFGLLVHARNEIDIRLILVRERGRLRKQEHAGDKATDDKSVHF
jgi:hypothetical protein